jgi:type IV secretion system protein VirB11
VSNVAALPARAEPSGLDLYLISLAELLGDKEVTEICINKPGSAWVERYSGWKLERLPFCTYEWCCAVARGTATYTKQGVNEKNPILSATLPSGERVQIVLPPVAPEGCVSITIRKPSTVLWTLDELAARDVFRDARLPAGVTDAVGFLRPAVQTRKNILLSGATGSGKTTVAKALILEIPSEERIVTIEDVRELVLKNQPNAVSMLYSQGGQGQSNVTGGDAIVSAKRMRPDRVFLSEMRNGDEAYDYLVSINSGHPGSITSVHADSAEGAFVALAQMMRRSQAGQGMSIREGVELAQMHVDIVVQCARIGQRRSVTEIWYDPSTKRRGLA